MPSWAWSLQMSFDSYGSYCSRFKKNDTVHFKNKSFFTGTTRTTLTHTAAMVADGESVKDDFYKPVKHSCV